MLVEQRRMVGFRIQEGFKLVCGMCSSGGARDEGQILFILMM